MMRRALHVAGVLAAFGVSTTIVRAQDPRIPGKIDAQSRIVLTAIIDSAKAQGLPLPPLLDKVDAPRR